MPKCSSYLYEKVSVTAWSWYFHNTWCGSFALFILGISASKSDHLFDLIRTSTDPMTHIASRYQSLASDPHLMVARPKRYQQNMANHQTHESIKAAADPDVPSPSPPPPPLPPPDTLGLLHHPFVLPNHAGNKIVRGAYVGARERWQIVLLLKMKPSPLRDQGGRVVFTSFNPPSSGI